MKCKWNWHRIALCSLLCLAGCVSAPMKQATPARVAAEAPVRAEPVSPQPAPRAPERTLAAGEVAHKTSLAPSTVEYHVWLPLLQAPHLNWHGPRYQMYTYVLYNGPANQGNLRYDQRQALARLASLLDTVGRSEDLASAEENQVRSQQDTNLFLIPALTANQPNAGLANYSIGVSRVYLDYFSRALAQNQKLHKRLRKYGPFLLATLKPIGEIVQIQADGSTRIDTHQPILLVDMSTAHEKSVAEVVRTFKNHVADTPMTDTTAFEPLRLRLISTLLKLNDAIPLVSNAVAGSCGLVGAEAACK